MTDALDIYNNTESDIVCANGTIPANSYISVGAGDAVAWAKDPIVRINVVISNVGISVYGNDLGTSLNGAADIWLTRIVAAQVVY